MYENMNICLFMSIWVLIDDINVNLPNVDTNKYCFQHTGQ